MSHAVHNRAVELDRRTGEMSDLGIEMGRRIRARREARGLTQNALGKRLGVTFQTVSKWERGETSPEISLLAPLAEALGVSVDWLLGGQLAEFVGRCHLFAGLAQSELRSVVALFSPLEVRSGGLVFEEGPGPNPGGLYIVAEGRVELRKAGRVLGSLAPGEIFSDYSFLDGGPCITRAVAMEDCVLYHLPRSDFERFGRTDPETTVRILLNELRRAAAWFRENE